MSNHFENCTRTTPTADSGKTFWRFSDGHVHYWVVATDGLHAARILAYEVGPLDGDDWENFAWSEITSDAAGLVRIRDDETQESRRLSDYGLTAWFCSEY